MVKTLKRSLNYHYIRNKNKMLLSTVMVVIYFTFLAVPGVNNVYMNVRINLSRYW